MQQQVIGLSIDEAIVFWRKAFGGTMTDDKFNKEYKYNIRHSFGLEGKRTNYAARRYVAMIMLFHPCMKHHTSTVARLF